MKTKEDILFTDLNVETLDLSGKEITEVMKSKISNMTALTSLDLQDTNISNLDFLTSLKNLKELDISSTKVTDLSPVSELISLEKLVAHDVPVYDLSPLEELQKLKIIEMERANIFDVTSLGKISRLEKIDLYGNEKLADIEPLAKLKNLKELTVKGTNIQSPDQLSPLLALQKLETLNVEVELEGVADNIISEINRRKSYLTTSSIFSEPRESNVQKNKKEISLTEELSTDEQERITQVFELISELFKNLSPEKYSVLKNKITGFCNNPEPNPTIVFSYNK